jgi:RimJ/RimL family protein N-acetyltransferase
MSYKLEPAFAVAPGLSRKLVLAGMNPKYQWFFSDGAFSENGIIDHQPNTWTSENFVVLDDDGIIAYFCATWNRPLDIISGFRLILFEEGKAGCMAKAFFEYLEYLFEKRGCNAFNWVVAEKNEHAYRLYEKFIKKYMGHRIGKRHYGQKSYTGLVSDVYLYEITKEDYFSWKSRKSGD